MKKYFLLFLTIFCLACNNKIENEDIVFQKDGCFYITAFLNDTIKGRFIFDTGASGLYIDSTFLDQHKTLIQSIPDTARMRGAGNTGLKMVLLIKDSIKVSINKHIYKFTNSPILKLTDINGDNIAGIIGNDFIKNGVLIINNEASTLRIDSVINNSEYQAEIPFDYDDKRIYISSKIHIAENIYIYPRLLLDLGCSDAIILNSNYYNNIKLKDSDVKTVTYSILHGGALGGNSYGGEFRASSLSLDKNTLLNPIISFSTDTLGAFSNTHYDGLLGNEVLDRYDYAIDYRNKKLYLRNNKNFNKPFKSTLTGFYIVKRGDYATVESIYLQSEAYKKGLQLGDTIKEINHKKISKMTSDEMYMEMKNEKISILVFKGGKPMIISFTLKSLL